MIFPSSPSTGRSTDVLRHAVLLACVGLTAAASFAQDRSEAATTAIPLTLNVAVSQALDQHPRLRAAQRGLEASEGVLLQSRARPNPELSYSQEDTRSTTRTSTVQLNQMLEIGGKRSARMRVAEKGREVAQAELGAERANLVADVRMAFMGLLAAQQRSALASQTLDIARSAREAAGKRVAAGKAAPLEENRARVAESGAQLEQAQAQAALRVARQQMQTFLGDTTSAFGEAQGALDALPAVPDALVLRERLEQAPSLLQARSTLEQSRATADLESAKRVPDPTVSLGVKRAQEMARNQIVFGVSIPLPLLDSNRGNQLQALRLADQAEDRLLTTRLALQAQLYAAREALESSRNQAMQLSSQVLPTAQAAYEAASKGFALGKFSYLEVLDAQRSWFEVRTQYLEQLLATHRAAADIDRLLGISSGQ
ncbi:TolC family protein [Comamonas terrigena]|uniref:TolC family protein n=1 Tax=Comamonas terrigena TaxID=32013 RepID=UPI0028A7255D|nr:TolC family protein [Comamonas terrigena]